MVEAWVIRFSSGRYEGHYYRNGHTDPEIPPYVDLRTEAFRWSSEERARAQTRLYRERGFPCEVLPWKE